MSVEQQPIEVPPVWQGVPELEAYQADKDRLAHSRAALAPALGKLMGRRVNVMAYGGSYRFKNEKGVGFSVPLERQIDEASGRVVSTSFPNRKLLKVTPEGISVSTALFDEIDPNLPEERLETYGFAYDQIFLLTIRPEESGRAEQSE